MVRNTNAPLKGAFLPDQLAHTSGSSKAIYKEGYAVFFRDPHTLAFIS